MAETRPRSHPLSVGYDSHTDTCYVFVDEVPRESVVRDQGKGVLVQYDRKTNQPIGIIIHDFEARFSRKEAPCRIDAVRAVLQSA